MGANRNYSVYSQDVFEVEHIVRKCVVSFPWIWVRFVSIDDT